MGFTNRRVSIAARPLVSVDAARRVATYSLLLEVRNPSPRDVVLTLFRGGRARPAPSLAFFFFFLSSSKTPPFPAPPRSHQQIHPLLCGSALSRAQEPATRTRPSRSSLARRRRARASFFCRGDAFFTFRQKKSRFRARPVSRLPPDPPQHTGGAPHCAAALARAIAQVPLTGVAFAKARSREERERREKRRGETHRRAPFGGRSLCGPRERAFSLSVCLSTVTRPLRRHGQWLESAPRSDSRLRRGVEVALEALDDDDELDDEREHTHTHTLRVSVSFSRTS